MQLGEKRQLFMRLLPRLIDKAHELGVEIRGGELLRSPVAAEWNATHCRICRRTEVDGAHPQHHEFKPIGIRNSLHIDGLAIDFNLFKDGIWLRNGTHPVFGQLGEFWESLDDLCCWGGRFGDPGHFSITHRGRK